MRSGISREETKTILKLESLNVAASDGVITFDRKTDCFNWYCNFHRVHAFVKLIVWKASVYDAAYRKIPIALRC